MSTCISRAGVPIALVCTVWAGRGVPGIEGPGRGVPGIEGPGRGVPGIEGPVSGVPGIVDVWLVRLVPGRGCIIGGNTGFSFRLLEKASTGRGKGNGTL